MKTQNVSKWFKAVQSSLVKHSPGILTGIGVAGMATTTVLAVKATPKAVRLIEEAKRKDRKDKLTPVENVKVAWKPYVPAAVTGVISIGCIIGASSVNARRNAALATAYQLSTTALNEYKDKVVETIGEDKAQEIREKIVEDKKEKISQNRPTYNYSSDEKVLILEPISNQYFMSTQEEVKAAKNEINGRLIDGCEYCISLNEFLDELELDHSVIGDDIGWTANRRVDLTFDDWHSNSNKPCFKIAYLQPPEHGYRDLY